MERMDGSAEGCEIPANGGCISRPPNLVPNPEQQGTANIMHDASTLCVTSTETCRALQVNTFVALTRHRDATLDCSCVVKSESYVVPIWRLHARLPTSPPRPFFCAAFYHDDDQRTTLAPRTSTY